jgi:4a-hydroxytetrahydrobiopterin dehydratase
MAQNGLAETNGQTQVSHTPYEDESKPLGWNSPSLLLGQAHGWTIVNHAGVCSLVKSFNFQDFTRGLDFAVHIGLMAHQEHHTPVLVVEWGRVTVSWSTREINGLQSQDFICAGKTDQLFLSHHSKTNGDEQD